MYVIKWIREASNEDHLKHIKYQSAIWGSLGEAMLFSSPEHATNYVVNNFGVQDESDRQEYLSWLRVNTKILYIHPLNIR